MTDPIAEYEEAIRALDDKKAGAIKALKKQLRQQKKVVLEIERRIAALQGKAVGAAVMAGEGTEKPPRKASSYVMTPAHKRKIAAGIERGKVERAKAAKKAARAAK
jgi:hypothetical protein